MKQALATLLVFLIASPASASYSLARPKTRVGGLTEKTDGARRVEWGQRARTHRLFVVCVRDFAAVKPEDNNGNTLSETRTPAGGGGTTTYTWDKDNRLRTVTAPSGISTFEYDANGLRTKKNESGSETRFLLDRGSVLQELDSTNATVTRYLNNPQRIDEQLAFTRGGADYWPLHDALGSIVAVSDASGAIVNRFDYSVQGERTITGAGPPLAFGFTGRQHDSSGLRYHRDRYFSPMTSNFLGPDRAGMIDGPNRYVYAAGNPIQYIDPFGFKALVLAGLIGPVKDAAGNVKGTIDDNNFDSFKRALKRHLVRESTFLKPGNRNENNVAVITYRGGEVTTLPSGWTKADVDQILYVGHADLTGPDILPGESAVDAQSFLRDISSFEALRFLDIYACGAERTGESFVKSVKGFVESRFKVYGPQDTITLDANFGSGGEVLSTWLSYSEREFLHYPAGPLVPR